MRKEKEEKTKGLRTEDLKSSLHIWFEEQTLHRGLCPQPVRSLNSVTLQHLFSLDLRCHIPPLKSVENRDWEDDLEGKSAFKKPQDLG